MPVKHRNTPLPQSSDPLVRELAAEIKADTLEGATGAPVIIEESSAFSMNIGVTVVWNRWAKLSKEDRSRIIMAAYREAKDAPPSGLLWPPISLALGLTTEEADRLRVAYR